MKIGFVCTNYRNASFTRKAIDSLMQNVGHEIRVVVVDNDSRDADLQALRNIEAKYEQVCVIYSDKNLGYFRGLNVGINRIRDKYPEIEWLIVGNNDLEFSDDFVDRVESCCGRLANHAVVSPDIVTNDGVHQNPHVIDGISKVREIVYDLYYCNYYVGMVIAKLAKMAPWLSERKDEKEWQVPRSIYQGHGSCYLLGPRFFETFSELWAPTFMMHEEYFISRQLSDAGMRVFYDPAIVVKHDCHGSLKEVPSRRRWEMARQAHKEYRKFVQVFR